MQILLMWRNTVDWAVDAKAAGAKLIGIFSALLNRKPALHVFSNAAASVVSLEIPVQGWLPQSHEEDESTWAMALDYPIDAREALAGYPGAPVKGPLLPGLCRGMQRNPALLLEQMSPPFALIWGEKHGEQVFVQNDGLGHAQLFEFDDGRRWAVSNRIFAFKALGINPRPIRQQWAVRACLGWFPLDMTGFKDIGFPPPATQIRITPRGVTRSSCSVIEKWIAKETLCESDCLELARDSIRRYLRSASQCWSSAKAGLSGGWDSRAIVASLLAMQCENVKLRVRGQSTSYDVEIARRLTEMADVPITVDRMESLPPATEGALELMTKRAVLWQAGYVDWHKHKLFPALNHGGLGGGMINIMGQYGEIGRGYYARYIHATARKPGEYEDRLLEFLLKDKPLFMSRRTRGIVQDVVRQAYRQADLFGLQGLDRLDFFYFYERTRRWASGTRNVQPGKVISPFLNPDFIRATFNLRPRARLKHLIHRHIVESSLQDWSRVQYLKSYKESQLAGAAVQQAATKQRYNLRERIRQWVIPPKPYLTAGVADFDPTLYWSLVGKDLIARILARDGFWSTVYLPKALKENWLALADDLSVLNALEQVSGAKSEEDWRQFGGPMWRRWFA